MPSAHDTFSALGPVNWESFAQEDLSALMTDIFSDAHCLISSIPTPDEDELRGGRGKGTAAAVGADRAGELRKEWKETKVNPRENPVGLSVYKLAAKDGKGSWFARRSLHEGLDFEKWKTGMEREFAESLKVQGRPGDGKIRGLSAEKRVVDRAIEGCGKMQVYQLSAQFPGPTAPRDFVTLCLSSDIANAMPAGTGNEGLRSYMLVSKPCVHPECPTRSGYIRGRYESVEFIREITAGKPPRRSPSSMNEASADSLPPAANGSDGDSQKSDILNGPKVDENQYGSHEESGPVIEWTMITRSDPGGSVPRFIIEKKTPDGIANDAGKFFQWVSSDAFENLINPNSESADVKEDTTRSVTPTSGATNTLLHSNPRLPHATRAKANSVTVDRSAPESPGPGGVYGMLSGALAVVAGAAASRLLWTPDEDENGSEVSSPESSSSSDISSIYSFHSFDGADDPDRIANPAEGGGQQQPATTSSTSDVPHSMTEFTTTTTTQSPASPHQRQHHHDDKELRKLEERRRRAEEKLARALAKKSAEAQRDEAALRKAREKHERDRARQEERYRRDRARLDAKRAAAENKTQERRRKAADREARADLALALERACAERDLARREADMLAEQVGTLQALNTRLVARLGREGIRFDGDGDGDGGSLGSARSAGPSEVSLGTGRGGSGGGEERDGGKP
ncbi:putative reticulocyte-binding protein 2 like protein a [Rosellinia necatrix]|uniref:Putative reticulocyte-binding protein 2 like protein a n=1 Tax=Rosellinia necatrix TaxID=77044 RepID=A0A1W2TRD8_ROSNE|nr:putative reticulocyte-binding protein 2 like protein a [Rosellinia necatrix]